MCGKKRKTPRVGRPCISKEEIRDLFNLPGSKDLQEIVYEGNPQARRRHRNYHPSQTASSAEDRQQFQCQLFQANFWISGLAPGYTLQFVGFPS